MLLGAWGILIVFAWCPGASSAGAVPLGTIDEFRGGLKPNSTPGELVLASDGDLWFTDDANPPDIGRITPSGEISEFSESLTAESRPHGLIAGPGGYLWFIDHETIGRVSLDGGITEFPLASSSEPYDLAVGAEGDIWFTERSRASVGRITPNGELMYYTKGLDQSADPGEIVLGREGDLWFGDDAESNEAVGRVTSSGEISEFSTGLEVEGEPTSLVLGPDGNVWFADNGVGKAIARITPSGEVTLYKGNLGEACSRGCGPHGLINGPEGDVWLTVGAGDDGLIGRITPAGVTTEFTPKFGLADDPESLVSAPDGDLWFSDSTLGVGTEDWAIGRMTPEGAFSAFSDGLDAESVDDLAVGSDGNVWFVNGSAIGRISISEPLPTPTPFLPPAPKTGYISVIHTDLPVLRRVATITLKCTGNTECVGKLALSIRVKHGRRARSKAVAITNTVTFSVAPGTVKAIKVHLRHLGETKLNATPHHIRGMLVVTQSAPAPAHTTQTPIKLTQEPDHHHA
jgi:streptogramin lyase